MPWTRQDLVNEVNALQSRITELETGLQPVIDAEREKCAKAVRHLDWGRWSLDEIRSCISQHVNDK